MTSALLPSPLDGVVGLGANLGDRLEGLRRAVALLGRRCAVVATSAVYESDPVGPPQPDYLNAAVRVRWPGAPRSLLAACLEVERELGRVRGERWGPRTIDLDVLWMGAVVVDDPDFSVPHASLVERPFALLPLLDVAPDALDPRSGRPFARPAAHAGVRATGFVL